VSSVEPSSMTMTSTPASVWASALSIASPRSRAWLNVAMIRLTLTG
jgi:hypothetical protein